MKDRALHWQGKPLKIRDARMNCPQFIERFSDYVDGIEDPLFRENADRHLASCPACRRYLEVFQQGRRLLDAFPEVSVPDDFYPRLQHRIYHLEDEHALRRGSSGSATTAATILGMAILLTVAAWSPLMRPSEPEVELSPIVVNRPADRVQWRLLTSNLDSTRRPGVMGLQTASGGLWESSHLLLYMHSPLSRKYSGGLSLRRAVLD